MKTRIFLVSTFWLTLFFSIGAFAQDPIEPSAPRNFQATAGDGYVDLRWDHPTHQGNPVATYEVMRATEGTPFTPIGGLGITKPPIGIIMSAMARLIIILFGQ